MSAFPQRHPLTWPANWPRTAAAARKTAPFRSTRTTDNYRRSVDLTTADAIGRLASEMRRLGVASDDWLISSNAELRIDGWPKSDREPADPGVAVYFRLKKQDRVLACDGYRRLAGNIAAIAAHIEALRAIERYGVGTLEQAFAGYAALPAKGTTWRTTLGFEPDARVTAADIDRAFRDRARGAHPDRQGGSHDAMASLTAARAEGLREVTAPS